MLVAHLKQIVEEAAGEDVLDANLARAQGVEEEEELAHSRAHIERVERLLQPIQLRIQHQPALFQPVQLRIQHQPAAD